jgi:hypothetical protein
MLCTCYWSHFTYDIEYHDMKDFKYIGCIEEIIAQVSFQQLKNKNGNIIF